MYILEWDTNVGQKSIEVISDMVKGLMNDSIEVEDIKTKDAFKLVESVLFGEYHCLLVKREEEYLIDSEVYLLTWNGEASEGGEMSLLDWTKLRELAFKTL